MLILNRCDNAETTNEHIKSLLVLNHPELKIVPADDIVEMSGNMNVLMISGESSTGKTQCMISSIPINDCDFYLYEPEPAYSYCSEYDKVISAGNRISSLNELEIMKESGFDKETYIVVDEFWTVLKGVMTTIDGQIEFAKLIKEYADKCPLCKFIFISQDFFFDTEMSEELFSLFTDNVIASIKFYSTINSQVRDISINERVHKQLLIE